MQDHLTHASREGSVLGVQSANLQKNAAVLQATAHHLRKITRSGEEKKDTGRCWFQRRNKWLILGNYFPVCENLEEDKETITHLCQDI